ncbi:MAG: hypothetical protein ACXVSL_11000 [Solirubrobacteraceae bacterium]
MSEQVIVTIRPAHDCRVIPAAVPADHANLIQRDPSFQALGGVVRTRGAPASGNYGVRVAV